MKRDERSIKWTIENRKKAFIDGSKWQKKQSAKKAVELFIRYCEEEGYTDYYAVKEFRKEMEK